MLLRHREQQQQQPPLGTNSISSIPDIADFRPALIARTQEKAAATHHHAAAVVVDKKRAVWQYRSDVKQLFCARGADAGKRSGLMTNHDGTWRRITFSLALQQTAASTTGLSAVLNHCAVDTLCRWSVLPAPVHVSWASPLAYTNVSQPSTPVWYRLKPITLSTGFAFGLHQNPISNH